MPHTRLHYVDEHGSERVKSFTTRKSAQEWYWGVEWIRQMETGPKTTDPFRAAHDWLFKESVRMAHGRHAGKMLKIASSSGDGRICKTISVWTSRRESTTCIPGDLMDLDIPLPIARSCPDHWIEGCDDEWGWLDPAMPVSPALRNPYGLYPEPEIDPEVERKASVYDELKALGLLEMMGIQE